MPTLSVCLIFSSIRTERPELASCRILQPPAEIVCSSIRTETDLFNRCPRHALQSYLQAAGRDILVVNEQTSLSGRKQTRPRMGVTMKDMLALGRVKKADTLDEMAKLINVPADHLKAAVAEYNKAASNKGTKDKFGFVATNTDDAPMTEGPWYAHALKFQRFTRC